MDVQTYMHGVGRQAREASRAIARADTAAKNRALEGMARAIERDAQRLIDANALDLEAARRQKLDSAMIDRLTLTPKVIAAMADGLRQIVALPDPVGQVIGVSERPSGIKVGQMRVPIGVVGIIYESRPNVTADAAGLCIKSGNAAILRGGSEALDSNQAIAVCVHEGLKTAGLPETVVQVIATTDRAAVGELITMQDYVDVIVPRGGKGLIERLMHDSRIPMIKHLHGVCHVYIDDKADPQKAVRIADNAKTQRLGVCNAMETLVVARAAAPAILAPRAATALRRPRRCWARAPATARGGRGCPAAPRRGPRRRGEGSPAPARRGGRRRAAGRVESWAAPRRHADLARWACRGPRGAA